MANAKLYPPTGTLDRKIELQEKVSTAADSVGQRTFTWTTFATVWAAIVPVSAREQEFAKSFGGDTSHKVTIRYRSGITRAIRILFGTRVLHVNGVLNPDERNVRLELFCAEGT